MWPLLSSPLPNIHTPSQQKASTHHHGVLPGRWFSLVILLWWETPPIWISMVPSLPSTHKTDWWALPSHFGLILDMMRSNETFRTLVWLTVNSFSLLKKPQPLSPQNYPLHGSEVNRVHPASLHSGSNSFGVPSHTPPVSGTDTIMGKLFCYVCVLPSWHIII